ncbi:hypothetical protein JKF63_03835 [Porcisia hertigi]|uniref:RRM domain-containing protein n=1 Tax=Porcisia hertigi TaxID=2761500 RepID=A0A836L3P8_9TRYP|nr:hypothetical protein JKF63_03835 [Porcisia hertigi]
MMPRFSTSPNVKPSDPATAAAAVSATSEMSSHSFEVVAGDYVPSVEMGTRSSGGPYSSKPLYSDPHAGTHPPPFYNGEEWTPLESAQTANGGALDSQGQFYGYRVSPVSDIPSCDTLPSNNCSPHVSFSPPMSAITDDRLQPHSGKGISLYTCRGSNADYTNRKQNRLHQDFKALPKEERQRLVEREAATSDLLARTVHLRFLPLTMLQSELGAICTECGEYLRVRICGNSTNNQNWIYGFVEFATTAGAEAMMRRSGMELNNGPGRPPLRLKCNSAKQPIVDRVFHDADPETGSPCIFGLGNFAKRTLGDALESYHNLKEKEAQQLQDTPANHSPSDVSPLLAAAATRPTIRLSPHARAFQPSSSPLLVVDCAPGVHHAPTDTAADSFIGDSSTLSLMHTVLAAQKADSDAASSDSAAGLTSVRTKHYVATGQGASSSSATASHVTVSPYQECPTFGTTHGSGAVAKTISGHPTTSLLAPVRCGVSFGSTSVVSPLETVAAALSLSPGRPRGVSPDFVLPPSREAAVFVRSSDLAGSKLSLALKSLMLTQPVTDGDEILERGRELALQAISEANCFLHSAQGFYDAMGTLQSLVTLLDRHAVITGGAVATGAGDHTAELPQRATQLRLLANLMMAFLSMMKRNLSEAAKYMLAVVTSCNDIPVVRLGKAQQPREAPQRMDDRFSDSFTNQQRGRGLAVGDGVYGKTEEASRYGCFGARSSLLEGILESIREEDKKQEEVENALASNSHNDATATTTPPPSSAENTALLQRDQDFHRYVLKVLLAIGLSMEEVNPEITRHTYALASDRAREALATASADLNESLDSMTPYSHLWDRLYSTSSSASGSKKRDITFFPRIFFREAERTRQEVLRSPDRDYFWQCLPPKRCVECYSE